MKNEDTTAAALTISPEYLAEQADAMLIWR